MEKVLAYTYKGQRADVGHLPVMRLIPNTYTNSVGPFVFLDHMLPTQLKPSPRGEGAHPHRGIATFTYLLEGTIEHYDSSGNHGIVSSGGIQWMKAGNGVIHEENVPQNMKAGVEMHGMQFWINLPPENKAEPAKYTPVQSADIPVVELPGGVGNIKVLLGEYAGESSIIEAYSDQLMYHIKLYPEAGFTLKLSTEREHGVFLPNGNIAVNGEDLEIGELAIIVERIDELVFKNASTEMADIIVFGGMPYKWPIIAQGPFVMNSTEEINLAYLDSRAGKYGKIQYLDE